MFELYGPEPMEFLNYVRVVSAANDGGKWRFDQSGEPLPGEKTENYTRKKIRERFSPEDLRDLLISFGLNAFDETFYGKAGHLVEKSGFTDGSAEEISLAQVQAQMGIV